MYFALALRFSAQFVKNIGTIFPLIHYQCIAVKVLGVCIKILHIFGLKLLINLRKYFLVHPESG
jgi:hypothetical protein